MRRYEDSFMTAFVIFIVIVLAVCAMVWAWTVVAQHVDTELVVAGIFLWLTAGLLR